VSFADLADRMKTSHPSAVIKHTAESFEATLGGVTVSVKKSGQFYAAVTSGKDPVSLPSRQEAEWHVSDELNAIWRDLDAKRPRTSPHTPSFGGGIGGGSDDLHVGGDVDFYEPSDDD
jgi:hypothetical protein